MTRGTLVQYLFVKGDRSEYRYGIVEKCGHKTMTIRWEGGSVGRVRRGMFDIRPISDPEIRKRVRANLEPPPARTASVAADPLDVAEHRSGERTPSATKKVRGEAVKAAGSGQPAKDGALADLEAFVALDKAFQRAARHAGLAPVPYTPLRSCTCRWAVPAVSQADIVRIVRLNKEPMAWEEKPGGGWYVFLAFAAERVSDGHV